MSDILYNNWNAMSDDLIARQIGEFVKHHRIAQSKTQTTLAKDAGISRSTLSLLERGETVTIATLIQVLRILDQLQVINSFTITQQPSPLRLANEEKERRQRAAFSKNKTIDINKEIDW